MISVFGRYRAEKLLVPMQLEKWLLYVIFSFIASQSTNMMSLGETPENDGTAIVFLSPGYVIVTSFTCDVFSTQNKVGGFVSSSLPRFPKRFHNRLKVEETYVEPYR